MSAKNCDYPFLANYLGDPSSEKRDEAIKHADSCLSCLEKAIRVEMSISMARKNSLLKNVNEETISHEQLYKMAERFVEISENPTAEKLAIMKEKQWQALWKNEADFAIFQEILATVQGNQSENTLKTPAYLKNIIQDRLKAEQAAEKTEQGIVIRLKEGLQLIGAYLDNVFQLPEQNEAFAVRSSSAAAVDAGVLQFYTLEEKEQKILYQVVQDGADTVMLTVKLQDFKPLPKLMKIKKDDRLIYSFPVKEDFAYFPQLVPGDYVIELKDRYGNTSKSVDISIVAE